MSDPPDLELFNTWVKKAMEIVGTSGWENAPQNALIMVAFGMLAHRLETKINRISKPAWTIALSLVAAVIWFIISTILGMAG